MKKQRWIVWVAVPSALLLFAIRLFCIYTISATLSVILSASLAPEIYYGTPYYTDNSYLEFDDGKAFAQYITEYPLPNNSEVTGFLYESNNYFKNSFTPHRSDIYMLEFTCTQEEYTSVKARLTNTLTFVRQKGDFTHYITSTMPQDIITFSVYFCDETHVIRYMMVTFDDAEYTQEFLIDMQDLPANYNYPQESSFEWTSGNGLIGTGLDLRGTHVRQ